MRGCCRSIAGSSRTCSCASCWPWSSARKRWPRASICRPGRWCSASLVKGPAGKQKLIDASTAQQIFGRAGRPQFDDRGYVFALAHEDDVRILRWKEKFDQIPETRRIPALLKAKKDLKRKKPTRGDGRLYWTEGQFKQLQAAPPGKLYSKGPIPWRLLAYLLKMSPEVSRIRSFLRKRLMDRAAHRGGGTASGADAADAGPGRLRHPGAGSAGGRRRPTPPWAKPLRRSSGSEVAAAARSIMAHAEAGARSDAGLPQHPSALRRVSAAAPGHRRSQRTDCRRWRACWKCRGRCCGTSACRGRKICRRGRWR